MYALDPRRATRRPPPAACSFLPLVLGRPAKRPDLVIPTAAHGARRMTRNVLEPTKVAACAATERILDVRSVVPRFPNHSGARTHEERASALYLTIFKIHKARAVWRGQPFHRSND